MEFIRGLLGFFLETFWACYVLFLFSPRCVMLYFGLLLCFPFLPLFPSLWFGFFFARALLFLSFPLLPFCLLHLMFIVGCNACWNGFPACLLFSSPSSNVSSSLFCPSSKVSPFWFLPQFYVFPSSYCFFPLLCLLSFLSFGFNGNPFWMMASVCFRLRSLLMVYGFFFLVSKITFTAFFLHLGIFSHFFPTFLPNIFFPYFLLHEGFQHKYYTFLPQRERSPAACVSN